MPVDALFERGQLQDFVHGKLARLGDVSFDRNDPIGGVELLRISRWIGLVGAEFVKIVVVRDVFVGGYFFRGAKGTLDEAAEFCRRQRPL